MLSEMGNIKTYKDDSARAALDKLNQKDGKVSGFDVLNAITTGTKDLDNQAAGAEYKDFAKWARLNKDRLSPEAQKIMKIYAKYAAKAQHAGRTGLTQTENKHMLDEMRRALMPRRPMVL
jgi:predicted pyridoxine 5'-phosphate oxidase superfamily flavin-nucleotide-binding protein